MKDILGILLLLLIFILFGLRLNIQISSIKKIKEDEEFKKFGIDNILFFIPELIPIKHFIKELGGQSTEEVKLYFHKIKIYRILFLIVVLLFTLAFFFF